MFWLHSALTLAAFVYSPWLWYPSIITIIHLFSSLCYSSSCSSESWATMTLSPIHQVSLGRAEVFCIHASCCMISCSLLAGLHIKWAYKKMRPYIWANFKVKFTASEEKSHFLRCNPLGCWCEFYLWVRNASSNRPKSDLMSNKRIRNTWVVHKHC